MAKHFCSLPNDKEVALPVPEAQAVEMRNNLPAYRRRFLKGIYLNHRNMIRETFPQEAGSMLSSLRRGEEPKGTRVCFKKPPEVGGSPDPDNLVLLPRTLARAYEAHMQKILKAAGENEVPVISIPRVPGPVFAPYGEKSLMADVERTHQADRNTTPPQPKEKTAERGAAETMKVENEGGSKADAKTEPTNKGNANPDTYSTGGGKKDAYYAEVLGESKETFRGMKTLRVKCVVPPKKTRDSRRKAFKEKRSQFIRRIVEQVPADTLKAKGLTDNQIKAMRDNGSTPPGWNIHHKIPLGLGRRNELSNFVMMRMHGDHKGIHEVYLQPQVENLSQGATREVLIPWTDDLVHEDQKDRPAGNERPPQSYWLEDFSPDKKKKNPSNKGGQGKKKKKKKKKVKKNKVHQVRSSRGGR